MSCRWNTENIIDKDGLILDMTNVVSFQRFEFFMYLNH